MAAMKFLKVFLKNYKLFDFKSSKGSSPLPAAPDDFEKYSYIDRHINVLTFFSVIGFACITLSTVRLYSGREWLYPFYLLLGYTLFYFIFSLRINLFPVDFNLKAHKKMLDGWKPGELPSVDVFLPTCGEPIDVLANTWDGVFEMQKAYPGGVYVHCLDDAHSSEVHELADKYNFYYHARPNKGWFKKAGNLRHGFENTEADFIAIFDADFRPRHDFLDELLPYFYADERLGIVQSPQYFAYSEKQNWLEGGLEQYRNFSIEQFKFQDNHIMELFVWEVMQFTEEPL